MDFPIEINSQEETETKINKNNLYYRYYLCTQKIQHIECKKYNDYKEVKKQSNSYNLYLTKPDKETNTNGVFPTFNFSSVSFKVCKFIPSFFDGLILKYNLHNLLKIKVKEY